MAKLDRLKEELGWLKVVFAILIATDLSLIGYLAKNYVVQSNRMNIITLLAIIFTTILIAYINKSAYKKLDEIEEL